MQGPRASKQSPAGAARKQAPQLAAAIELIRIAWGQIKQNQISKRDVESKTIDSTRVARGFHRETQEDAWCRHLGLEAPNHRHRRSEAWYIARPGCSIYLAGRWIMDICFVHKDFESGIYRDIPWYASHHWGKCVKGHAGATQSTVNTSVPHNLSSPSGDSFCRGGCSQGATQNPHQQNRHGPQNKTQAMIAHQQAI